jgi:TonB family protein
MEIQPDTKLEKIINQAGLAKAEAKYEEARLLYAEALKDADKFPNKTKIRILLSCQMAECLYLSGRTKSAEEQYFQSLSLSRYNDGAIYSRNYAPLVGLGYLYLRSGQYEEAKEKFKLALGQTPDKKTHYGVKAREGLGLAYAKQGEIHNARECFDTTVKDLEIDLAESQADMDESAPKEDKEGYTSTNYANLAYCEYVEGDLEDADKHYVKAEERLSQKLPTEGKIAIEILKGHRSLLNKLGRKGDAEKLTARIQELEQRPLTYVKAYDPAQAQKPGVGAYMNQLQNKIKAQWHPPSEKYSKHAVVSFKINRDGSVKDLVTVSSTGVAAMDESGIKAIEAAAPFPPLPKSLSNYKAVKIEFSFDYNVYGRP